MERLLTIEYVSIYVMLAMVVTAWLCAVGVMWFKRVIIKKYDDDIAYSTLVGSIRDQCLKNINN